MLRRSRAWNALGAAAVVLATGSATPAGAANVGGDQAKADAAIVHRSDLGDAPGWTGGVLNVDVSRATHTLTTACQGYHSTGATAEITAAAGSRFENGLSVISSAFVAREASYVTQDLRALRGTVFRDCLRRIVATYFEADRAEVTITPLALPNVASSTVALRTVARYSTTTRHYLMDIVGFRRGRTEVMLAVVMPAADTALARKADLLYARIIAARI